MKCFPVMMLVMCTALSAHAEDYERDYIRCRLDPACPNPGLRGLPISIRGVQITGDTPETPNSVNFHITFAYDSAELQNDAQIALDTLGRALGDRSLKEFRFLIAGHTDAKGSDEYNQALSERRAEAVADYLKSRFGFEPSRFDVRGFGKTQLFDPQKPEDEVNRRVQIVNIGKLEEKRP